MAKNTGLQTDFEDDIGVAPVAAEKDMDGVPYCVKHHCRMHQTSGGKAGSPVAYFKCPVDGCEEKAKRVKTAKSVPAEPMKCPRCMGLSPQPIMERDNGVSTLMYSILKCPCCGHKSATMPRPEFVANHASARGFLKPEEIGSR